SLQTRLGGPPALRWVLYPYERIQAQVEFARIRHHPRDVQVSLSGFAGTPCIGINPDTPREPHLTHLCLFTGLPYALSELHHHSHRLPSFSGKSTRKL